MSAQRRLGPRDRLRCAARRSDDLPRRPRSRQHGDALQPRVGGGAAGERRFHLARPRPTGHGRLRHPARGLRVPGDFNFIVADGASPDEDRLVEVHCFYSERFLFTIHRDDCPAFAEIRRATGSATRRSTVRRCCSTGASTGSWTAFFPILADSDDRIDEPENAIFLRVGEQQLQEIFRIEQRGNAAPALTNASRWGLTALRMPTSSRFMDWRRRTSTTSETSTTT